MTENKFINPFSTNIFPINILVHVESAVYETLKPLNRGKRVLIWLFLTKISFHLFLMELVGSTENFYFIFEKFHYFFQSLKHSTFSIIYLLLNLRNSFITE